MICCLLMNLQARKLFVRRVPAGSKLRIAHISDLHFDKIIIDPAHLIREICKARPEIIVITGDLCSDIKYFERVTNFLDMLAYKAGCPVLVTLGNHDNRIFTSRQVTKQQYIAALESVSPNIKVLENEYFIYRGTVFGGLTDVKSNAENLDQLISSWRAICKNNGYDFILLTHNPDIVLKLPTMPELLILLAGHTHGGQVRVPFNLEFTLLKKDILPKKGIFYGLQEYHGIRLYITSGIGCSLLPIRFRSTAEIAIIE